jgi:hypothetical protein
VGDREVAVKDVKRTLYRGQDGIHARYEIARADNGTSHLRLYDIIGGDALVFLTPARARRLIADLRPYAVKPRKAVRR